MIRSAEFSIVASATAARMARQWLWRRWMFFAIPVVALLMAGWSDIRYAIVGLMLVFIAWPMALSFVWFGRALSPAAVRDAHPHSVDFSENEITIRYSELDGYPTPQPISIPIKLVSCIEDAGKYVIIKVKNADPVIMPADVLTPDDWRQVRMLLQPY